MADRNCMFSFSVSVGFVVHGKTSKSAQDVKPYFFSQDHGKIIAAALPHTRKTNLLAERYICRHWYFGQQQNKVMALWGACLRYRTCNVIPVKLEPLVKYPVHVPWQSIISLLTCTSDRMVWNSNSNSNSKTWKTWKITRNKIETLNNV